MVFDLVKEQTVIIEEMRDMIKEQNSIIRDLTDTLSVMAARVSMREEEAGVGQD
jgi:uncharacterized coiled-coil protein SlyX